MDKRRILIVDDESMARALLRLMLVRAGFEVVESENGADALAKVAKKKPDLVLLDVMMPGMDGFEVCLNLRANHETIDLLAFLAVSSINICPKRTPQARQHLDVWLCRRFHFPK